jgi:hypothetical protein
MAALLLVAGVATAMLTAFGFSVEAGARVPADRVAPVSQVLTADAPVTLPAKKKKVVLTDRGAGKLRMNMSVRKAKQKGLLGKKVMGKGPGDRCVMYRGKKGVDLVYGIDGKVVIIDVSKKIRLKRGVGIGDTYQDLVDAYGKRVGDDRGLGLGRIYLTAPKAPIPAHYRIELNTDDAKPDSKITDIALQPTEDGCYE